MENKEKRIEVIQLPVSQLKFGFGNPRKALNKKQKTKLIESIDNHGDFGLILIDEFNNVIGGNQRVTILKERNADIVVLCKRLIGYSISELKAINIKDNTHSGEWDLDKLAEWTADLSVDLGLDLPSTDVNDRTIDEMELIRYEKYDYVMIVTKNEIDYLNLLRNLGIENKKVPITNKRKIRARAIWYDNIECTIKKID